ncbi:MAG TPA: hypothetical protein VK789_06980 [Bryobacteraceae bacterium]|nr:hypothetical protein [Bryobacteraceae bacterium]
MAFRVYLSYSLDAALAVGHDIKMFIPKHDTKYRGGWSRECKFTDTDSQMLQNELRYALDLRKLVIPIVRAELASHPLLAGFQRFSRSQYGTIRERRNADLGISKRAATEPGETTSH